MTRLLSLPPLVALMLPLAALAQSAPGADTIRLRVLHAQAVSMDPRERQLALSAAASELRQRNIGAELLPSLSFDARAQYQSEVTKVSVPLPGVTVPAPPHDTYDANLTARQALLDPTIGPSRALERAQLAETQADVRVTLQQLRQELNDAFFSALSLQESAAELDASIGGLAARLREASQRFRAGAALPGDTAVIAATVLERRQDRLRISAERAAALARLSSLAGTTIGEGAFLAVPDLTDVVAAAVASIDTLRLRPEYARFDASRERIARQRQAESSQDLPRLSAFGRIGYGRPGLDMLSDDFQTYWLTGLQVSWSPWNWGVTRREREALAIQARIVESNEAAFRRSLQRSVEQPLAAIARLDSTLALDDRIVALRELAEREAAAKLREGAITAADYVSRSTEALAARVSRIQHRVELARVSALFLTSLGVELP